MSIHIVALGFLSTWELYRFNWDSDFFFHIFNVEQPVEEGKDTEDVVNLGDTFLVKPQDIVDKSSTSTKHQIFQGVEFPSEGVPWSIYGLLSFANILINIDIFAELSLFYDESFKGNFCQCKIEYVCLQLKWYLIWFFSPVASPVNNRSIPLNCEINIMVTP